MTLADAIQAALEAHGPMPAGTLAVSLRKRKADVVESLRSDARFAHTGKTKASLWDVRKPSFDATEAAVRWRCTVDTATEIIFGPEGFLARGFVESLNSNSHVVVTERGLVAAAAVEAAA